jgi:hypothetical protein
MTFAVAQKLDEAVEEYRQELAESGVNITFGAAKRFLLTATLERLNKEEEQVHQIETALSETALKAFAAGPHKTKDGHTEIRWPPAPEDER